MLAYAPRFAIDDARTIARDHWGIDGDAHPLPSERDQNFRIVARDGASTVLKIANALDDRPLIEAQHLAMTRLVEAGVPVPRVLPALDGSLLREVEASDGRRHLAWMVSYLPGIPLASLTHRSTSLLESFGRRIGTIARALRDFDHPALHRDFHWDLARAERVIAATRSMVAEPVLGAAIDSVLRSFERNVAPQLPGLRRSAMHGDLNDHNVLAGPLDGSPFGRFARITGIVDFGDMVHGWSVSDLAIAAAYVAVRARDPLGEVAALVRGCHAEAPLEESELSVLYGLMLLRLAQSACVAAHQRAQRPDDPYLDVSQDAIRSALPRLASVPHGLAEAVFRDACGLEPVHTSAVVREWLAARTATFAPIIDGVDLRTEPSLVLDLSVGSALVSGTGSGGIVTTGELTERIDRAMRDAGVRVAVGRYDEPRLLYAADFFARPDAPDAERRTVHIGLDLFAPAGTPVHAPLDGTVHAFADNHVVQDYGPVIILRHRTDDGTGFFTLYGHLSKESLDGLTVGRRIARGERFATLGAEHENVGWTPHLHLQIITDLLGLGTDFPGVGAASQRAVWRSLSPDPNLLVGIPAERFPPPPPDLDEALERRSERFGRNLTVSYRRPVRATRGWMQFMFDDEGRRLLDAYNNVPHVGHCHPRVVAAGRAQMSVLATNTRYLGDKLTEYADRLVALFPEPLRVVYLVSSASEANELALRLARAYTGRRDTIVLEQAYHGNTTTLIDISPYKHTRRMVGVEGDSLIVGRSGFRGTPAPDWVHVAPLPDVFRGAYRHDDPEAGAKYARHVDEMCRRLCEGGRPPAAFIAESAPSVAGQVILPPGYLREAYTHVRAAGGLCIADEVQTGLGRLGTHLWAFEAQDVVPDIVVLGKPLGNGHPLAAVVTTRSIADVFAAGPEYFSTFGGNTVSCAIGLAVLDVMRDEQLQTHARAVGEHMLGGLRTLMDRHELVGDVRGSGLFLGVELVRDRTTLAPAGAEARWVVERMREEGMLIGTEGRDDNVIKIRPPMPFTVADADRLVETMDRVLAELR